MQENAINRKIILLQTRVRPSEVARSLGLTPQAVHNEIYIPGKSRRIREALCEATNTPAEIFWPEFNGENKNDSETAQA